eukprot:Blabericola_migrator_1__4792@NODE_2519_length_2653_cov_12_921114_g1575_i0_p4_GENE_NODE_2519_length_2653_cov_12_921114_g1575_i0NODE_2519_length_2653_cov_12_921114_g1575_i0_p4_ORF_typecomplete_len127_score9_28Afaf/PF15339_6/0_052_NODE_2519_length_2653_cov_12_921114_g1575_i0580960
MYHDIYRHTMVIQHCKTQSNVWLVARNMKMAQKRTAIPLLLGSCLLTVLVAILFELICFTICERQALQNTRQKRKASVSVIELPHCSGEVKSKEQKGVPGHVPYKPIEIMQVSFQFRYLWVNVRWP